VYDFSHSFSRVRKDGESPAEFSFARNRAIAFQVARLMLQALSADEPLLSEARVSIEYESSVSFYFKCRSDHKVGCRWITCPKAKRFGLWVDFTRDQARWSELESGSTRVSKIRIGWMRSVAGMSNAHFHYCCFYFDLVHCFFFYILFLIPRAFRYQGSPLVQIRSVIPMERFLEPQFKVESEPAFEFPYSPLAFGYHKQLRYATNIPGIHCMS